VDKFDNALRYSKKDKGLWRKKSIGDMKRLALILLAVY
jgi:hypothetical protein